MAKKTEEKEERKTIKANEMFGVSEKRSDEIIHAWKHARLDVKTWQEQFKLTVKNAELKGEGEFGYLGYIFGRAYEQHESPADELFDLLDMLFKAKGASILGGKIAINGDDMPEELKKILVDHLTGKHKH